LHFDNKFWLGFSGDLRAASTTEWLDAQKVIRTNQFVGTGGMRGYGRRDHDHARGDPRRRRMKKAAASPPQPFPSIMPVRSYQLS